MGERVRVPAGVESMPPGPRLAAVLARLDRSRLDGSDLVTVMQARARQVAHEQAQLLADMVAVAHCSDADTPAELQDVLPELAAAEIAAALSLTRRAADNQLGLAEDVVRRLPALHAAMLAGEIDQRKAWVICQVAGVADEGTARRVVDRVLPHASVLTTGQIAARLRKLIATADPDQARDRHARAVAQRRVGFGADPDGTAGIYATGLPADRVAAAMERVDALARAARVGGDPRSMDQLRADTYLDVLVGDYTGPGPVHRRGVIELTVPLTTLIGLSEQPGELAGFGPVIADIARQVAQAQRDTATWRFAVTDPRTGRLVHHGSTRRRPTKAQADQVRATTRRCVFPGCRMPATRCDIDHLQPHSEGGATEEINLGPLCRHHHRGKQPTGPWRCRQIMPGVYAWISPLHRTYLVAPEPP